MTDKHWMDPEPNAGTREVVRAAMLGRRRVVRSRDLIAEAVRCEALAWGVVRAALMQRHRPAWHQRDDLMHAVRELRSARVWRSWADGLGWRLP